MSGKNRTSPEKIGPLVHPDMSGKYQTSPDLKTDYNCKSLPSFIYTIRAFQIIFLKNKLDRLCTRLDIGSCQNDALQQVQLVALVISWGDILTPWSPHSSGIILCMRPANEKRYYIVTSLIGWVHTQNMRNPFKFRLDSDTVKLPVLGHLLKKNEYMSRTGKTLVYKHVWNQAKIPPWSS